MSKSKMEELRSIVKRSRATTDEKRNLDRLITESLEEFDAENTEAIQTALKARDEVEKKLRSIMDGLKKKLAERNSELKNMTGELDRTKMDLQILEGELIKLRNAFKLEDTSGSSSNSETA